MVDALNKRQGGLGVPSQGTRGQGGHGTLPHAHQSKWFSGWGSIPSVIPPSPNPVPLCLFLNQYLLPTLTMAIQLFERATVLHFPCATHSPPLPKLLSPRH